MIKINNQPTIKIIETTSCWDIIGSLSMAVTAIFTIILCGVAIYQLRNLINNNCIKTILDLEFELYKRKLVMQDLTSKIRIERTKLTPELNVIYEDDLKVATENYFNILDRLAYCILYNYLKDSNRNWESEYSDLIKTVVRENEASFLTGTYYKNIKKLYEKWNLKK